MGRRGAGTRGAAAACVLAIGLAACGGGTPSVAPASSSPSATPFDLAAIEGSVAYIQTQGTFVTVDGASEQVYSGSGFVIDPSGLIVTNNHVVAGGAFWKVQVGTADALLDARLLGVSECSDLAVLKVDGTFPALRFSSADPKVGEAIYVAGHPNGDPYTLTNGIVAKPPHPADTSWASVKQEIQITAQTYPGNSGSPVVNAAGEVVAVHYAGGAPGSDIAGQSFAISAAEAAPIIDQLKAGTSLDTVGLNGQADAERQGIAIISVVPGSPADRAGIEAGDLLTNFNGVAVGVDGTKATYCSVLRTHTAADVLSVTVTRGGASYKGEINGRVLALAGGATPAPTSGPTGGPSTAIDLIEPYVPSDVWASCRHSTDDVPSAVLQTAVCTPGGGATTSWYDLYDSAASLAAAVEADAQRRNASTETSCDSGAHRGTWKQTFADGTVVTSDAHVLLCYADNEGNAWIEQADPGSGLLYWVEWKGGSQADLFQWWKDNSTIMVSRPGG